jgi:hypothetical protein
MKQLLSGPVGFGLACVGLLLITRFAFPQYTKFVVIGLFVWGAAQFGVGKLPPRT